MPNRAPRRSKRSETDEDLVRLYLDEIGRYELLTKDGEVRLARRIEAGAAAGAELGNQDVMRAGHRELEALVRDGEEATRQFVQANLRLVVSIAKKYQASGLPLLDLIQEGNLGLIHAVEKFEWRKGFKFSTYATWWVRQAIQRGIANTGRTIRVPVSAGERLIRVLKLRERLEGELGRAPRTAELAAEADMSESALAEVLRSGVQIRSLSETPDQNSETEPGELLADAAAAEPFAAAAEAMLAAELEHLLALLDADEQQACGSGWTAASHGASKRWPRSWASTGARCVVSRSGGSRSCGTRLPDAISTTSWPPADADRACSRSRFAFLRKATSWRPRVSSPSSFPLGPIAVTAPGEALARRASPPGSKGTSGRGPSWRETGAG